MKDGAWRQQLVCALVLVAVPPLIGTLGPKLGNVVATVGLLALLGLAHSTGLLDLWGSAQPDAPDPQELLLLRAEQAFQERQWRQAKDHARRAVEGDASCARAWELLAAALQQEEQYEAAADTVRKAQELYDVESEELKRLARELALSLKTVEDLVEEAERCLEHGNYSRLRELSTEATLKDPRCARAWELVALALKAEGKRDEAASTVREAMEQHGACSASLSELSQELAAEEDPLEAAADCEKKGEDFMSKRQFDLAAESFASALRALGEPSSLPGQIVVSGAEAAQERRMGLFTRTAVEQAGRPVYQNSNGQYLYYWKPAGCWRIGPSCEEGNAGVKSIGKEADRVCPMECSAWKVHHQGSWTSDFQVQVARGEETDAERSEKALRLRLLRRRAECAQQLKDWETVRADATLLLAQDPDDAQALLQRAAANEALEKFRAALEDARRLLALDSKSAAANRIVENCRQEMEY